MNTPSDVDWLESFGNCGNSFLPTVQLFPVRSGYCHGRPIREIRGCPRRLSEASSHLKCARNPGLLKTSTRLLPGSLMEIRR